MSQAVNVEPGRNFDFLKLYSSSPVQPLFFFFLTEFAFLHMESIFAPQNKYLELPW